MRASDAERDGCVAALRHHYSRGRLDAEELEQRLELATRARTRGELKAVLRDLPRSRRRRRSPFGRAALRAHGTVFVAVNGGLAGIWAATGDGSYWPGGVLAPWAVGLGWHAASRVVGAPWGASADLRARAPCAAPLSVGSTAAG